jgi:dihydropteroate synthase
LNKDFILKIRDRDVSFTTPKVMGILNATPDSFSDGGEFNDTERALLRIGTMISEGADIIDIGGESTRPGSDPVSEEEETRRVIPLLRKAVQSFPEVLFSVDTTKYSVAKLALEAGAHIVNDVSGLKKEPGLAELCASFGAGYVLMHSQGDPKTMQLDPQYYDVIKEISSFFREGIEQLKRAGAESIILDPGIGFGKTLHHNCSIVAGLKKFSNFGYPLLMGASRKSMIGQILNDRPVDGRLAGTIAVHYHSLTEGANILRVHDVQEAADSIKVYNSLES